MKKISKWILNNVLLLLIIWSMFYIANILIYNNELEKRFIYVEKKLMELESEYMKLKEDK